jgi:RimJ/RimL family protein N-acetyltransferase
VSTHLARRQRAGLLGCALARRMAGDVHLAVVALRPVADGDLDALFEQMRDPEGVRMAAFTPEDPDDRNAFDAHMAMVRSSPDITLRAVICDGHLAGSIASFPAGGQTEVTYWIDRAAWGKDIATRALALLLELVPTRPLYGRAASDNVGSLRVLQNAASTQSGPSNRSLRDGTRTSRKPFSGWTPDGRTSHSSAASGTPSSENQLPDCRTGDVGHVQAAIEPR